MEEKEFIGRYNFFAEPFHCDFNNTLMISHLGNYILNAADFHSDEHNFGITYLNKSHRTWVLSRLSLDMKSIPKAYDHFFIETWLEGIMRYFTNRNFKICDPSRNLVYGYGRSIWAMIDTETREPVDLLTVNDGCIEKYIVKDKECSIVKTSRVKIGDNSKLVQSIQTHYSDVDMNGHVNSIKYIEHMLNIWPLEWYRTNFIKKIDIAYIAESHCGDLLNFYLDTENQKEFKIRITKKQPTVDEEIEVCRCRVLFQFQ